MTEKRYNVWDIDGTIFLEDHKEGSYHIGLVGHVDINCLNDIANRLNDLTDGNEQLKSTINTLTHDNTKMKKVLNTTKKENEQIKHLIKEAIDNERTELGKSVLKQLLETIQ